MLVTKKEYDLIFEGYYINGVAVRDTGYIYFTIREKRDDIDPVLQERMAKKNFVSFSPEDPIGEQWGAQGYEGLDKIWSATTTIPLGQYIGVDMDGRVYVLGSGIEEMEETIPEEKTIMNSRSIGGRLYIAGSSRYVARRLERNRWEALKEGIKKPTCDEHLYSAGFNCLDGFSEQDIYAAGGKGDLWHFNGNEWRQINFPSNMLIESICCGRDGFVYIGALSGTVFKGRENQWTMIHRGMLSLPFRQMVWFQDRVWATSDYGVWQIVGDKVISADLPSEVSVCAGYISCSDTILALAGFYGAARLDGKKWDILINCVQAEKRRAQ